MFSRAVSRTRLLLIALLTAVMVMAGALSWQAQAHDRLVGSDPEDGSEVVTQLTSLTLSYNAEPQDVEPRALVTGAVTGEVPVASITVSGTDVVVTFTEPLPNDEYTVAWRVVSSDGHPIEGELGFTVNAPEPTTEPAEDPTDAATTAPADEPTAEATTPPASDDDDDDSLLWLAMIGGIAVIGAAAAVLIQKQRRHNA